MTDENQTPPYRIETRRAVVRCFNPVDAPLLTDAINRNLDHLGPWMPWARHEPEPVANKVQRLRKFRGQFDLDVDYTYGVFTRDETELIGGAGLHTRIGAGAFEIGYWICVQRINEGLATEVGAALVKVAFEVSQINRIEIHCDPSNARSARVPEKLGFTHEATLRDRDTATDGKLRDSMVWTLFPEDYRNSPSASVDIKAFDVLGNRSL